MNTIRNLWSRDYARIYAATCYALIILTVLAHIALIDGNPIKGAMHVASICVCVGYGLLAYTLQPISIGKLFLVFAAFTTFFWI